MKRNCHTYSWSNIILSKRKATNEIYYKKNKMKCKCDHFIHLKQTQAYTNINISTIHPRILDCKFIYFQETDLKNHSNDCCKKTKRKENLQNLLKIKNIT